MLTDQLSSRRVALVSGAGRGIGASIAAALARDGADIALNYNRDEAAAQETAGRLSALGAQVRLYQGSVGEAADCAAIVESAARDFGRLDILVHNAGIASRGLPVAKTSPDEVEKLMRVHAFGAFYLAHYAMPHLLVAPRGDIVMLSSIATAATPAGGAPYTMAKAAIEALAKTLAKEVNRSGIRVNVVAPGLTATEMGGRLAKAVTGVETIGELDAAYPFGHVCTPQEVAKVVAFLCSPSNGYVSGQVIYVEGGQGGGFPTPPKRAQVIDKVPA